MSKMYEQHELPLHGVLVLLVAFLAPALAFAHAEEPNSENIFALDDGWVLRANVGIVQSSNPTELICEEAFLGGTGWLLGVLGPSEWITWGETVIMRSEDGCSFDEVMEITRLPSDATVHRPSGRAAFIMNGTGDEMAGGLWVSTDRGQTFEHIQDLSGNQTTGVRFIDESSLFVSGYDREDSGAGLAWVVAIDTGEATPVTVPADVTYPYVLAAAPDTVLLLGRRGDQIVFWGPIDNVGQNEIVASTWPSWGQLSDDGQTAYISGMLEGRGVTVGTRDGAGVATWESVAEETRAGCVEPVGEELFICGLARFDDYDVLRVTADSEVEGVLDFRDFEGVRSDCPADSEVGEVCPRKWPELAPYFGIEIESDVGDAGGNADMGSIPDPDSGQDPDASVPPSSGGDNGGCCATTRADQAPGIALLMLAFFGIRRRRR